MKILAVSGSPRKTGNTNALLDRLIEGAREKGAEVEKVVLQDLKIKPCRACDRCRKHGRCVVRDDMQPLYDTLLASQAIVIASPVYWWSISAQTKLFYDRWYALVDQDGASMIKGKKAAFISVCADADHEEMSRPIFEMFRNGFDFLGARIVGTLSAAAFAPGEVAGNAKAMADAFKLGKKLASAR